MTSSEYEKEVLEIEEKLAERRMKAIAHIDEVLLAERQKVIDSLNNLWTFKNDTPPPIINSKLTIVKDETNNEVSTSQNSSNSEADSNEIVTRNDRLRDIVRKYTTGSEVTTQRVFDSFQEKYPDLAPDLVDRKTIISKVLREMQNARELERIQAGSGNQLTIYRKL